VVVGAGIGGMSVAYELREAVKGWNQPYLISRPKRAPLMLFKC
jgi:NADH dehydrogenase FAD-containing subunit